MQLTRFTDYSLRTLMYLGLCEGQWVTIRQIADAHGISRNHLMKIVSFLARKGYVDSQRGPGGGVRLDRPPQAINIAELIRDTENDLDLVECFGARSACRLTPVCRLRAILSDALEAFLRVLGEHSLADLIEPRRPLEEVLQLSAPRVRDQDLPVLQVT